MNLAGISRSCVDVVVKEDHCVQSLWVASAQFARRDTKIYSKIHAEKILGKWLNAVSKNKFDHRNYKLVDL